MPSLGPYMRSRLVGLLCLCDTLNNANAQTISQVINENTASSTLLAMILGFGQVREDVRGESRVFG